MAKAITASTGTIQEDLKMGFGKVPMRACHLWTVVSQVEIE